MNQPELKEQSLFHNWLYLNYPEYRIVSYHIPNEGKRTAQSQLISAGMVPGIPDYHIAVARGSFNSLYLEFKDQGKDQTPNQKRAQEHLENKGNLYELVFSAEEAKEKFLYYNSLPEREIKISKL